MRTAQPMQRSLTAFTLILAVSPILNAPDARAQSLGEVAAKEKRRREQNAASGIAVRSYQGVGDEVTETAAEPEEERPSRRASPSDEKATEELSSLEKEREKARALEPRMSQIAAMADRVDRLYQRYLDTCHNRYAIGLAPPGFGVPAELPSNFPGRAWFPVWEGGAAPTAGSTSADIVLLPTPQCQALWDELVQSAEAVRRAMQELLTTARRERILPGMVRELREKYRLEWAGWER